MRIHGSAGPCLALLFCNEDPRFTVCLASCTLPFPVSFATTSCFTFVTVLPGNVSKTEVAVP